MPLLCVHYLSLAHDSLAPLDFKRDCDGTLAAIYSRDRQILISAWSGCRLASNDHPEHASSSPPILNFLRAPSFGRRCHTRPRQTRAVVDRFRLGIKSGGAKSRGLALTFIPVRAAQLVTWYPCRRGFERTWVECDRVSW
jgi:hypothetical protein